MLIRNRQTYLDSSSPNDLFQARRNEKKSGGATNHELLLATMVGRPRKFFISNRLKALEKLNICRRQVM